MRPWYILGNLKKMVQEQPLQINDRNTTINHKQRAHFGLHKILCNNVQGACLLHKHAINISLQMQGWAPMAKVSEVITLSDHKILKYKTKRPNQSSPSHGMAVHVQKARTEA